MIRSNTLTVNQNFVRSSSLAPPRSDRTSYSDGPMEMLSEMEDLFSVAPSEMKQEYQEWLSELRTCISFLQDKEFDRVDKSKEIEKLTQYWLTNYFELNIEENNLSRTDLLFYIRCFLVVCDRGNLEPMPMNMLLDLYNRLAIFSCNHNCNARMNYPSKEQIRELEDDCFGFIVQHYFSLQEFRKSVDRFIQDRDEKESKEHKVFEMAEMSNEMQTLKKSLFVEDEKTPNSNKGYLWTQDHLRMLLTLIPLADRVFSQVYREQRLLDSYRMGKIPQVPESVILKLQNWLIKEVAIDAEDDLRPRYVELLHELQIPMGGRLTSQRKLVTRDDHNNSLTIIEKELGYDTSLRLTNGASSSKHVEVAKNPDHDNYTALLITLWDLRLTQLKKTEFLKNHVVLPTALSIKLKPAKRFETLKFGLSARAPLVTLIQRKWKIHYLTTFYTFETAAEALLVWARIITTEFGGEIPTSGGINIKDKFFDPFWT